MGIKNLKELKIELIKKEVTATWLASELGYSRAYLYRVVADQNKKEIERIKKILSEV